MDVLKQGIDIRDVEAKRAEIGIPKTTFCRNAEITVPAYEKMLERGDMKLSTYNKLADQVGLKAVTIAETDTLYTTSEVKSTLNKVREYVSGITRKLL